MAESVYIFTNEDLAPFPFLTTPSLLAAQLTSLFKDEGWGPPPDVMERQWRKGEPPSLVTERGYLLAVPATLENLHSYGGVEDPAGLFWQAVGMALYGVLDAHLSERAGFGELRRVKGLYEEVTE